MSIPNYQKFMLPILKVIADGKEYSRQKLILAMHREFNFSEEELNITIASGKSKLIDGRISWAQTYLVQAGLIKRTGRGVCVITEDGIKALETGEEINSTYLRKFEKFQSFISRSNKQSVPDDEKLSTNTANTNGANIYDEQKPQTPAEELELIFNTLNVVLATELLESIVKVSPQFFEDLVVDLMIAMGYGGSLREAGESTRHTKDGGVDGIIKEDKLGLEMIYLQAKRYTSGTIGRPDIQAFVGALEMHRAKKGVFITTTKFTSDAKEYVKQIEKRVILIDGEKLTELMIEHNLGLTVKKVYEVKELDTNYFVEE